jgi:L-fucose mutarotase
MPLKGIPKILSPDILHTLSSMGHGDEIILADAHFPAASVAKSSKCGTLEIRLDACTSLPYLLEAVLKLFPLDPYVSSPVSYMDLVDSDKAASYEVSVWKDFQNILDSTQECKITPKYVERFEFYERSKRAFAIIQTG